MIRLQKNADIFSSVGEKIGKLDRVVLDPDTKKVTHIVAKQGLFFSTSKVIPISYVNLDGDRITLTKNEMELETLPDFTETSYLDTGRQNAKDKADSVIFYPPHFVAWWATRGYVWYPKPKYVSKTEEVIPEETVALEEGARVISKDGENVGEIERIIVAESDKRASHLIVSRGLLSKNHKLVPTLWITDVTEDKVYLTIDSEMFERLPEHELVA